MVKRRFEELDCACSGVDDHMEVYITSPKEEDREAVEMFLREQTRLQGKAFTVYSIEKIPKNEAGKTLYKELKPNGRAYCWNDKNKMGGYPLAVRPSGYPPFLWIFVRFRWKLLGTYEAPLKPDGTEWQTW